MARASFAAIAVLLAVTSVAHSAEKETQTVWLDELDVRLSVCGWRTTQRNRSVGGQPLKLAGQAFKRGIGTHSPGLFRIALFGGARRFVATIGIDAESEARGSVEFKVIGDGKTLFASGVVKGGQPGKRVDVKLTGVKQLDLVVTTGGNDYAFDHADWADARIEFTGTPPKAVRAPASRPGAGEFTFKLPPAEQVFEKASLPAVADRDELGAVLRRTAALLAHLATMADAPDLSAKAAALKALRGRAISTDVKDVAARKALLAEAAALRRQIAFANPLLSFDHILFIKRHFMPNAEKTGNHMCDQYFGFHAIEGGGLFVLEKPFSDAPTVTDVLADAVCETGRFKGRKLDHTGGYLSPELSFDGKRILFSYTDILEPRKRYTWTKDNTWHIFSVNADGTGLRQLTDGTTNDFDPCFLPSGRIAFISERRGGYGRCHGRPVPSFTLHSMNADGSDIVMLSPHETNEWHPSVDHDGMIVYTRWDYVDRGFNQAHHPWLTTPDGRDSRSIHGNFSPSARVRPHMEMDIRAIPGSHKYIATAACHHGQAYGSVVIIDPKIKDDDAMAPVKRVTPDQPFPESECRTHRDPANYGSVWPLSEHFYLCVYDANSRSNAGTRNNYGIYLLDAFGNKELLYRDDNISCLSPIPLRPRPTPPVVPHATLVGKPLAPGEKFVPPDPAKLPKTAEVAVVNVYDSQRPFPKGTKITALRIVQLLPKTTPYANNPRIGYGSQKSARAILGTVPVAADGSAHFRMPVDIPVYFQALDANGMAVQSMRSATYVHHGEKLICQGCHENRHEVARPRSEYPLAMRRLPSKITPGPDGSKPFSFPRLIQPVLNRRCVGCHAKKPKAPDLTAGDVANNPGKFYPSYNNLRKHSFFFDNHAFTTPITIPGKFGARASKLYRMLRAGHHDVELSTEEMRRIVLWLDSNSDFFGSYADLRAQARGEIVRPTLE